MTKTYRVEQVQACEETIIYSRSFDLVLPDDKDPSDFTEEELEDFAFKNDAEWEEADRTARECEPVMTEFIVEDPTDSNEEVGLWLGNRAAFFGRVGEITRTLMVLVAMVLEGAFPARTIVFFT